MTLAELAIHIPASIEMFEKYNFNYYQNGSQKFKDACEEKGLIFSEIDAELNQLQKLSKTNTMLTLEDMSVDRLIDFINGQHHSNEAEVLDFIEESIKKLITNPNCDKALISILQKLDEKFTDFKDKLTKHCEKEDKILFPYMRKLCELRRDKIFTNTSQKNSFVKKPIQLLEAEHVQASSVLKEIKEITQNFSSQANAPKEYQKLMEHLKEFEVEFHVHLHIENNILFPKVIALEEQFSNLKSNQA
jgi:regulator of cell morphogenesis and NO signaling